jgi:hypothetical protein
VVSFVAFCLSPLYPVLSLSISSIDTPLLSSPSTGWSSLTSDDPHNYVGAAVWITAIDAVLYLLLACWVEKVFPPPGSRAESVLFFLQKDFWFPEEAAAGAWVGSPHSSSIHSQPLTHPQPPSKRCRRV